MNIDTSNTPTINTNTNLKKELNVFFRFEVSEDEDVPMLLLPADNTLIPSRPLSKLSIWVLVSTPAKTFSPAVCSQSEWTPATPSLGPLRAVC